MKLTVKHYYSFGKRAKEVGDNLISENSWDVVRIDDENLNTPFSIPPKREDWIKKCISNERMLKRAEDINKFIKRKNFKKIISFGAGACFMEYNLKHQNSDIVLECSDFNPKGVLRLKEIFTEATISMFDMLHGEWKNEKGVLYLFHRIDTDFSDAEWKYIFKKMYKAGVDNILFVPCNIDTYRSLFKIQLSKWYQIIIKKNKLSFAGYLRTKDAFRSLFLNFYNLSEELNINDLTGFFLTIKK